MDLLQEFPVAFLLFRVEDFRKRRYRCQVDLDSFVDLFQQLVISFNSSLKTFHLSACFTVCADVPKWNPIFADGALDYVVGHEQRCVIFSFALFNKPHCAKTSETQVKSQGTVVLLIDDGNPSTVQVWEQLV